MKWFIIAAAVGAAVWCGFAGEKKVVNKSNEQLQAQGYELATFAGGCFWCIESAFEQLPGVKSAVSGYTGGHIENPTYEQVCSGTTGHTEAVQIAFDPKVINYKELVDTFWKMLDPTDAGGSFYDRGSQYRSAIFYHTPQQKIDAEKSKDELSQSKQFDKPIVTTIEPLGKFWVAEEYHQDYYKTNTFRYRQYKNGSGRNEFFAKVWGKPEPYKTKYNKPSDEELKEKLTDLQYTVTQKNGTERAFSNLYWDNKEEGIYVDIVSGEPLFSSKHKYKSGTGWPSFYKPIKDEHILEKKDSSHGMIRVEVRSKYGDSHLGHLFDDGPAPTGQRYCINSASLKFIPKGDLEKEGYKEFIKDFE